MSFTSVCIIALLAHVGAAAPSKLADTLDSVRELATHNKSVAHAAPALLHSLALHERARALYGEHAERVPPALRARAKDVLAQHARALGTVARAAAADAFDARAVAGMQAAVARNEQRVARQYAALGGERAARRLQESVPRDGDAAARAAARERRRADGGDRHRRRR